MFDQLTYEQKLWISTAETCGSALMPAPCWLVQQCLEAGLVTLQDGTTWMLTPKGSAAWTEMWGDGAGSIADAAPLGPDWDAGQRCGVSVLCCGPCPAAG